MDFSWSFEEKIYLICGCMCIGRNCIPAPATRKLLANTGNIPYTFID